MISAGSGGRVRPNYKSLEVVGRSLGIFTAIKVVLFLRTKGHLLQLVEAASYFMVMYQRSEG